VNALFANVMTPEVTRQMILNRQHRAQGGSRPYGLPGGVEPAVADYRRMHQPNLLPAAYPEAPEPEPSGMGVLTNALRAAETVGQYPEPLGAVLPQSYNLPVAAQQMRAMLGGSDGDVDVAYRDRFARDMARRYHAQRLRQAALIAQTDPEGALAAYPGPMIGAQPGTPLGESNRPAVRAAAGHRAAEKAWRGTI
jgi:hypothetical protein